MKKGLVLIMVSGIMVVITILAVVALNLMTVESRTAEHKIKRTRAYFSAQAGIVDAFERLRRGEQALPAAGNQAIYNLANVTGNTVNTYNPRIIIMSRGAADRTIVSNGITYTCRANTGASQSAACLFATVDYQ